MGAMKTTTVLFFALAGGCGSGGNQNGGCPSGQEIADPDGRGSRCISNDSECFDRFACGDPDVEVACCRPSCGDPELDLVFTCQETCRAPDCATSVKCDATERCEVYGECSASCVPDEPCDAGELMADPDGTGFRCIAADSDCFKPADCAPSANPMCCETSCTEGAGGRFACEEVCEDGTTGAAGIAYQPLCYHDADCFDSYGAGNWTCDGCPGHCVWAVECEVDADCVIASDARVCCGCPAAWPTSVADADDCVAGPDEVPPPECLPEGCDAEVCGACPEITGAICNGGSCEEIYAGA